MESKRLFISFMLYKAKQNKKGQCPIQMRITIDGQRENIATGLLIEPRYWDENKCEVKGAGESTMSQNNLLITLKSRALTIYTELLKAGLPVTSAAVKAKLVGRDENKLGLLEAAVAHSTYVKKRVGIESSAATLVKYETVRQKMEHFIIKHYHRKDILLSELTQSFIVNFELFLKTEEKIGHNTTTKYIQCLKRVINFALANDWIKHSPFKAHKCTFKPVHREALTLQEVDRIAAKTLVSSRLEHVRDVFIFCCYTGLAYADVKKLRMEEVVPGVDGNLWIHTFRAKTTTRVPIPLLPEALRIINHYQEWRREAGTSRVLPVLSNQKMNAYLKEIGDCCGISKKLTFHIARHTFATVSLNKGVPIESVSKLLGHTNIKTTQIYAKVQDQKLANDISVWKK